MVEEFNKIVGDTLAAEGAVHLPGVGSLVVVRRAAERISSRRLRRSCNAVILSDKVSGRSIADVVAGVCGTDAAGGAEIYERWRSKSSADGVLAIDGVGHIDRREFFVDDQFDRLLNPNGHQVVELVKYRRGGALKWVLTSAAVVAAVVCAVCYSGLCDRRDEVAAAVAAWFVPKDKPAEDELPAAAEVETPAPGEPLVAETIVLEQMTEIPEAGAEQKIAEDIAVSEPQRPMEVTPAAASDEIGRLTSGWSYVVYGVFSTPENAMRAVAQMRERGVEGCSAFVYGSRYLVALYFSSDSAECSAFMREAKGFENLWVYTAR